MGRSSQRGTGRIIPGGWDGAEDEDAPYSALDRATARRASTSSAADTEPPPAPGGGEPDRATTGGGPLDPAPSRRRCWWLIGGIATLLALVLVLPPVLVGERSPEAEARTFLQAILDADTDTVREHMAPPADGAVDAALTDAVLLAATDRVDRFTIEETAVDGDRAQITATLRLGNRTEETTLQLTRQRSGILHRPVWELDPVVLPVMRVAVPVSASSVVINGVEVALPAESTADQAFGLVEVHLAILPGVYRLSAPEGGETVTPTSVRSSVPPVLGPWTSTPLEAGYALTDAGHEELGTYLTETALAECARSTSPRPPSCPLAAPEGVTADGTWEILTPPAVRVTGGAAGYYEAYGSDGVAEFTVPAGDGGSTVHRVPIEEGAMGLMDRDGRLVGSWYGNQEVIIF